MEYVEVAEKPSPAEIADILSEDIENMNQWALEPLQSPAAVTDLFETSPVREVVAAARPELVIHARSNDLAIAGATRDTVLHCFDEITKMDARDLFQSLTEQALILRREVKDIEVLPWQPLGVLCVPARLEYVCRWPAVHIFELSTDLVGPGSERHCLKSTYTTIRSGMPVVLESDGHGWALGVLVDKAMRRDDVICQAVAILAAMEPPKVQPFDLSCLPRWSGAGGVCQGDALVANLTYALQHTPDDEALLPFRHFSAQVPWLAFGDSMQNGVPFTLTLS